MRRALVLMLALGAAGPAPAQQFAAGPAEVGQPTSPRPPAPRPFALAAPADGATPPPQSGKLAGGLLTLDPIALYEGSAWFRRVQDSIGADSTALNAENDRLAEGLAADERELTERRGELPPEEFRARAAAFDAKVVQTRREQEDKARRLTALAEAERNAFFRAAIPVFAEVMAAHEAVVILDRQSVFISAEAVDVTDELLRGVDARLGAGTPQPLPEAQDAPRDAPTSAPEVAHEPAQDPAAGGTPAN